MLSSALHFSISSNAHQHQECQKTFWKVREAGTSIAFCHDGKIVRTFVKILVYIKFTSLCLLFFCLSLSLSLSLYLSIYLYIYIYIYICVCVCFLSLCFLSFSLCICVFFLSHYVCVFSLSLSVFCLSVCMCSFSLSLCVCVPSFLHLKS